MRFIKAHARTPIETNSPWVWIVNNNCPFVVQWRIHLEHNQFQNSTPVNVVTESVVTCHRFKPAESDT